VQEFDRYKANKEYLNKLIQETCDREHLKPKSPHRGYDVQNTLKKISAL